MARKPNPNIRAVQDARDEARPLGEGEPPQPEGESRLPPDCPVKALGKDGSTRYYLDADRQLAIVPVDKHTRLGIIGLFGNNIDLLYKFWPRYGKGKNEDGSPAVVGWRPEEAQADLMSECSRLGVWDPSERQRGRGAWLGDDGSLVLHTGSRVLSFPLTSNPWRDHLSDRAGLVGRYVYSAGATAGAPSQERAASGPGGPAQALLDLLGTWNWRRPETDPLLMLGWIGAAMMGGALKWRPMCWLTGGTGTGKSTLQELLKQIFAGGIIQTADTTPAGLWQALKHQTLPVAVDELEAEEDNRRAFGVVKLARTAASGALMLRGGADHKGTEFVVRSAFLFSSILIPPLTPQDRNRITVLELDEQASGSTPPVLEAARNAALGAALRRRLVDGWPRFGATLEHFHASLKAAGHSSRAADQLGVMLAAADLLLFDETVDSETSGGWVRNLNAGELAEAGDNVRDEDRCLAHLLSSPVDAYRNGGRMTVAEWIRVAIGVEEGVQADARRVLGTYGIKLVENDPPAKLEQWIAVANYHQGLAKLFENSHWKGGSGTMGVWMQALRRLPGATKSPKTMWFGGASAKATVLPLGVVVPAETITQRQLIG